MTISEKYFRRFYNIKEGQKLSSEQFKVVRMMHECLRENNQPKLPKGSILVNKSHLTQHLKNVRICLDKTDELMENPKYRDFANGTGGKELAKIMSALNYTMHSVMHFQLNIPLERLNDDVGELLID